MQRIYTPVYMHTCDLQKHIHSALAADRPAAAYAVPEWRQQLGWICQRQQDPPAAAPGPGPKVSMYQQPVKVSMYQQHRGILTHEMQVGTCSAAGRQERTYSKAKQTGSCCA